MSAQAIISPCIGICSMNDAGLCAGCYRSIDEIREWWDMGHEQREAVMSVLDGREQAAFGD